MSVTPIKPKPLLPKICLGCFNWQNLPYTILTLLAIVSILSRLYLMLR